MVDLRHQARGEDDRRQRDADDDRGIDDERTGGAVERPPAEAIDQRLDRRGEQHCQDQQEDDVVNRPEQPQTKTDAYHHENGPCHLGGGQPIDHDDSQGIVARCSLE